MNIIPIPDNTQFVVIIVITFISLVLLAWVRTSGSKYLNEIFPAVVFERKAYKLWVENSSVSAGIAALLNVILFFNLSVLVWEFIFINRIPVHPSFLYILVPGLILSFFAAKQLLYYLIGSATDQTETTSVYVQGVMIIYRVFGLSLFPVIIAAPFCISWLSMALFVTAAALFVSAQLLIWYRAFVFCKKTKFSIFYLFLYLCTLEIFPVLFIFKIALSLM